MRQESDISLERLASTMHSLDNSGGGGGGGGSGEAGGDGGDGGDIRMHMHWSDAFIFAACAGMMGALSMLLAGCASKTIILAFKGA
jgi:hypothetical protein